MFRTLLSALLLLQAPGLPAWAALARLPEEPGALAAPRLPALDLPAVPALTPPVEGLAPAPASAAPPGFAAPAALPAESAASGAAPPEAEAAVEEGRRRFDRAAPDEAPPSDPVPEPPRRSKLPRSVLGAYLGHGVFTVLGMEYHILSQPFLVKDTLGLGPGMMGLARNIHMSAMALVNFLPVGALLDRTDYRVVFISTTLVRAALMAAIPALYFAGHLHFPILAAIIAVNPIFQSVMVVADGAAIKTFLGKDEKLNKDATATLSKWEAIAGAVMPLFVGWTLGMVVSGIGLGGYALAYGIYSGLLLASIPIYWRMMRDPRFPQNDRMSVASLLRQSASFIASLLSGFAAPFRKRASKKEGSFLERHEFLQGFAFILRSRVLTVLAIMTAVEMFMLDALPFVVLPSLITEALHPSPEALGWLASWPAVITSQVATAGGLLGLLSAAEYLGRYIPASRLEGEHGDALIEKVGRKRFYRRAAVASLLFWALLAPIYLTPGMFWVNIAVVGGVLFTVQLFHAAVPIVIAPLKRNELDDEQIARVESAFFMIDVAFEAAGALLVGLVIDFYGITAGLIVLAAFFTLTGVFQWFAPRWLDTPSKK